MDAIRTEIHKSGKTIVVEKCYKQIEGKIMRAKIVGTDRFYSRPQNAIIAANEMLLKQTLSEKEWQRREDEKARLKYAKRIVKANSALKDTKAFIKRWEGIIVVETKKRLCAEMEAELKSRLEQYKFKSVGEAEGIVRRNENKK